MRLSILFAYIATLFITIGLVLFIISFLVGCGDEGVVLDTQSPTELAILKGYDNAPGAPSVIPEIPYSAITSIETSHAGVYLTIVANAFFEGYNYIYENPRLTDWTDGLGSFSELTDIPASLPYPANTYTVSWEQGSPYVYYQFYGADGYTLNTRRTHTIRRELFEYVPETPVETPIETPIEQPPVNPVIPTNPNANPNPTPVFVPSGQIQILDVTQRGDRIQFNMRLLDREAENYVISCGDAEPHRITYNRAPHEPRNEHGSWFGRGRAGRSGVMDFVQFDTYTIRVEVQSQPHIYDELTFRYDDHTHGDVTGLVDQVKEQGGKTWHYHIDGNGWHTHGVGNHNYDSNGNYSDD